MDDCVTIAVTHSSDYLIDNRKITKHLLGKNYIVIADAEVQGVTIAPAL